MGYKFELLTKAGSLFNRTALLRLDLNVRIQDGKVLNDFRLRRVARTLEFLMKEGAKTIVLAHLDEKEGSTLFPVFDYFKTIYPFQFTSSLFSENVQKFAQSAKPGSFLLSENIRSEKGEVENEESFAKRIAGLADFYVNEAFSVSHRYHASIVGVPKFLPSYAGFLFAEEVAALSKAFDPSHPTLFIIGGAKFETKLPLVKKFARLYDSVFIGGALANDFFKMKGFETGTSLTSALPASDLKDILENQKVLLPSDVLVRDKNGKSVSKDPKTVESDEKIIDAGPLTLTDLQKLVRQSRFILWNGPLGEYESGFGAGTEELAHCISKHEAFSILGGGDTLTVIGKLGMENRFGFVSTGGGAMLQFLAEGTLPGITALENCRSYL